MRDLRWNVVILALALAVSASFEAKASRPAKASTRGTRPIATVNSEPITYQMLARQTLLRYGDVVLEQMINRRLVVQACKARGIRISKEQIENEIKKTARGLNLPVQNYLKFLELNRQLSPKQYSNMIVWPMLSLRALVADQTTVTDEEIQQEWARLFGEAVKCRMIIVSDKNTAERLRQQCARHPKQFGALAKKYSLDDSASVGGLIPPIRRFSGHPELEKKAFAIGKEAVSDVFPFATHWAIIKQVQHLAPIQPSVKKSSVVKQQIHERIRNKKLRKAASKLYTQLQQDAKTIKILGDPEQESRYPGIAAIVNNQKIAINEVANRSVQFYGQTVLKGEITRKIIKQALRKERKQVSRSDIDAEIARAAIANGFLDRQGDANVNAWLDKKLDPRKNRAKAFDLYVQDEVWPSIALSHLAGNNFQVSKEDLHKGFEANYGRRAKVMKIALSDQRVAQKVWEIANGKPHPDFFSKLVMQYSIDVESRNTEGHVPPISRFGGNKTVEEQVFKLKPGELSSIIEIKPNYYVIFLCQGFTAPATIDLASVRDQLEQSIIKKKRFKAMATKYDQLLASAKVNNFLTPKTGTKTSSKIRQVSLSQGSR